METFADKFLDWHNTGFSVVEQPHRSPSLLNIPDLFSILFAAGGASLQFAAIPFNLIGDASTVDYFVTGHWFNLVYEECKRLDFPGVEVRFVVPQPNGMSTGIPSKGE
jgi:phosphoserine aminotransferase